MTPYQRAGNALSVGTTVIACVLVGMFLAAQVVIALTGMP